MASEKQESANIENDIGHMDDSDDVGDNETPVVANSGVAELIQLLRRQHLRSESGADGAEFSKKKHTFWGTQPMPHERFSALEDAVTCSSKAELVSNEHHGITNLHVPIEPNKPKEELRQSPYNMPPGFEWVELNLFEEKDLVAVYELLRDNYVEDDSCKF
jgi:glycylpeptide N-tetradecanoyltransferase